MNKKWTPMRNIKFLECYEQFPCLWDIRSSSYKNRKVREEAYAKMAKSMNIDGFSSMEVKAKIRSIRNSYTSELAKIAKSKKCGSDTDNIYKPNVRWFPIAHRILHKVVQIRDLETREITNETDDYAKLLNSVAENVILTIKDDEEYLSTSSKPAPKRFKKMGLSSKLADLKSKTLNQPPSEERNQPPLEEMNQPPLEEMNQPPPEEMNQPPPEEMNQPPPEEMNQKPPEENEFDCFGKYMASQLKKLPESLALESMAFIQSYLVQQRLKSSNSSSSSSSPCNESRPHSGFICLQL